MSDLKEKRTLPMAAESGASGAVKASVYDPAMCCPTGVCGPSVDEEVVRISRDLKWIEGRGVRVERFNLAQEPHAFAENPRVVGLMQAFGDGALPAVLVNGVVAFHGAYPSRQELVGALKGAAASGTPEARPRPGPRTPPPVLLAAGQTRGAASGADDVPALAPLDWTGWGTRYLFFTGKGGVGKTTVASAASLRMAESGKRVLVVSPDPASNLDDVFGVEAGQEFTPVPEAPNLYVMNLDPEAAAEAYKEKLVGPYRGVLPESALRAMEEQLSGACTVEIAAFNEFTGILSDANLAQDFDRVVFDTAPTGQKPRQQLWVLWLSW